MLLVPSAVGQSNGRTVTSTRSRRCVARDGHSDPPAPRDHLPAPHRGERAWWWQPKERRRAPGVRRAGASTRRGRFSNPRLFTNDPAKVPLTFLAADTRRHAVRSGSRSTCRCDRTAARAGSRPATQFRSTASASRSSSRRCALRSQGRPAGGGHPHRRRPRQHATPAPLLHDRADQAPEPGGVLRAYASGVGLLRTR